MKYIHTQEIQLDDLMKKSIMSRTNKRSASTNRQIIIPKMGSRFKLILLKDSWDRENALQKEIIEITLKGGPKSGAKRREILALTENDFKRLRSMNKDVYAWISASKQNAALFAIDPVGALAHVGKNVDKKLLMKLKNLERMKRPKMLPLARISSITVETSDKPAIKIGPINKQGGVEND